LVTQSRHLNAMKYIFEILLEELSYSPLGCTQSNRSVGLKVIFWVFDFKMTPLKIEFDMALSYMNLDSP